VQRRLFDLVETESTDLAALRRRVADLEADLDHARREVGRLQLQLDLFTSTDPLTGFVNRSGTLDAIQAGVDRLDRMGETFALVFAAIPLLSVLGREAPDLVAETRRHVGALVAGGLRRVDRVGRLEDDTFVTVLANVSNEGLTTVLERLRKAVDGGSVQVDDVSVDLDIHLVTLLVLTPSTHDADELLALGLGLIDEAAEGDVLRMV
jgi:GGDEF domain-containing protein